MAVKCKVRRARLPTPHRYIVNQPQNYRAYGPHTEYWIGRPPSSTEPQTPHTMRTGDRSTHLSLHGLGLEQPHSTAQPQASASLTHRAPNHHTGAV